MKTKKLIIILLALLSSIGASAYTFKADGIYYSITSNTNKTVEVTFMERGMFYPDEDESAPNGYVYERDYWESDDDCGVNLIYYFSDYSGSISIPSSVTYNGSTYQVAAIGNYAFYNCLSVTSITIPNSVTKIGTKAFRNCKFSSISIGNGVTSIESEAFADCTNLTRADFPSIAQYLGITYNGSDSNPLLKAHHLYINGQEINSLTIPNSVSTIMSSAFKGCTSLTSVTIPNNITSIGASSFEGCTSLITITIPNSVTNIGNHAFEGCSSLTSVKVKIATPLSITTNTFSNRTNATLLVPLGSKAAYEAADCWKEFKEIIESTIIEFADAKVKAICVHNWDKDGDEELSVAEAATVTTFGPVFNNTAITSFNELQYFTGLTSIWDRAFDGCSSLTSINIPDGVTSIGNFAFNGCSSLTSINIPDGVTSIGNFAFNGCSSLTSITIPNSVTSLPDYAFDGCSGLTSITLPNSVTSLPDYTFSGCSSLTSITIPNSVTSIGFAAFSNCSSLTSITIPNSVTTIGSVAFNNCSSLTSITLPNNVTGIFNEAFKDCSGLTSITIPNSVTGIGYNAFLGCYRLTSIIIPSGVTIIGSNAFDGCSNLTSVVVKNPTPVTISLGVFSNRANATLYVPAGSKAAYEAADYWKEFKRIIEFIEGDVNGDGEMDVVDVVDIARYVVGTPAETFVQILADINNNGEVNLGDAVSLVNMIAGDQNFVKAQRAPQRGCEGNEALTLEGADGMLSLALQNTREYTAFQFDLYVPEATDVTSILLNAQRKQRHQLLYNKVEDGHWRVAAISTSNRTFNGYEGELLRVALEGIANDDISIRNIRFFDMQSNEYAFDDICLSGTTTGIEGLTPSSKAEESVYDLQGRKVANRQMPRGIYIVNGKKVVRK